MLRLAVEQQYLSAMADNTEWDTYNMRIDSQTRTPEQSEG